MESLTMASPRSSIGKNVKFVEEKQLKLLLIGKNNYEHKKMHNNYTYTINFSLTLLKSKFMKLQSSVCIKKLFFFNFDQAKAQTTFFSKIKYFALSLLESTSDGKCHFMKNQWFSETTCRGIS